MTRYVATVNVPGYLPMDDEPPVFDTIEAAWDYLARERKHGEDAGTDGHDAESCPDGPACPWDVDGAGSEYGETHRALTYIASGEHAHGDVNEDNPTSADGTGWLLGATPGSHGDHDLGLAYSVSIAEEGEEDE